MSIQKNAAGVIVPTRESRNTTGTIGGLNAETVISIDGDESCIVQVIGSAPVMTLSFLGSIDGVNYFPLPAYCLFSNGVVPVYSTPFTADALTSTIAQRVYSIRCAQLKTISVRATAYTSGSVAVAIRSDAQRANHQFISDKDGPTLLVSSTAAVSTGLTLTLPAVPGLRHYINSIVLTRSATAALTASATPVVTTSANIPGALAFTFGSDAGGIGIDIERQLNFGGGGLACTAVGTATTITMPVWTGVIWRAQCAYKLGL